MKRKLSLVAAALAALLMGAIPVASASPSAPAPTNDKQATAAVPLTAVCEYPANATNPYAQTRVVSSSTARFYSSTAWTNLECGRLTVTVPRGRQAALVATANAELTCTGPTPDQAQWCQGRILVGGVEGYPRETEADGSFAWAQSSPDAGAWEANTMVRSLQLRCPTSTTTQLPCAWSLQVQVRNHATGHNFRVDGSSVAANLTYM